MHRKLRVGPVAGRTIGSVALVVGTVLALGMPSAGAAGVPVSPISGGYLQNCAVTGSGTVECWGNNISGQLGNGSTTSSDVPVVVQGLYDATAVSTGGYYSTCALTGSGTVECWGYNFFGQLGDGSTTSSDVPVPVTGITDATAVAAGGYSACAVLATGSVECWGYNTSGQLGDGSITSSDVPVAVSGISGARAIAVGDQHACALLATGSVECWGDNGSGQLGNGSTATSDVPVPVTGLSGATAVTAGYTDTCALTRSGTVECWGDNVHGQLGDGSTTSSAVPVPVLDLGDVVALSAGGLHNCALTSAGTVECWGYNTSGQLGNLSTTPSDVPVVVTGLPKVTAVAAGGYHTCAVTTSGTVECWGYGDYGELGNGSYSSSLVPVVVKTLRLSATATSALCPSGARTCVTGTSRPGKPAEASSGRISVLATGRGALGVGLYREDPVAVLPGATGRYFAVATTAESRFSSVSINVCGLGAGSTIEWWNGSAWQHLVTEPGFDTSTVGCTDVTLGATSTPSLATASRVIRLTRFGAVVFGVTKAA